MKRIGVTGGLGSGKSYICQLIEKMGYPVFYTDIVAKDCMTTDATLKDQVQKLVGEKAYFEDGSLNRTYLSAIIFSDNEKRKKVNEYIHPAVYRAFDKWCAEQQSLLVFIESALMIDTGYYKELDSIILVVAGEKERLERIVKRDNHTLEEIIARMDAQSDDGHKKRFADYVIDNSEGKDVKEQLEAVLREIK